MNETNTDTAQATRAVDAEHRRWLIGLAISIAFGTFGAVMAWLSYSARTRPTPTPSVQVAKPVSGEFDHPARRLGTARAPSIAERREPRLRATARRRWR